MKFRQKTRLRLIRFFNLISYRDETGEKLELGDFVAYQCGTGSMSFLGAIVCFFTPMWAYNAWERYIAPVLCKRRGHKWVDESWANENSGGIGGHCERCGYGFSHTYY